MTSGQDFSELGDWLEIDDTPNPALAARIDRSLAAKRREDRKTGEVLVERDDIDERELGAPVG